MYQPPQTPPPPRPRTLFQSYPVHTLCFLNAECFKVDRGLNAAQAGHLRLAAAAPNVSGSVPAAPDAILDERYAKNASGSGSANASAGLRFQMP